MDDCDGCSFPFLIQADGSKLVLNLGDNRCIISDDSIEQKQGPFQYFLPGKHDGEVLCTFSALFDGSVVLAKESNSAPEIYVNGNRVAAGVNIDVQTGDSVMLGSSRYSYIVDLNDADVDETSSNTLKLTDETFTDVFTDVFVSGDMNIDFVDFDTGKRMPLDQQLVTTARGVALSSIHQLEITVWIQWLGLLTNRKAVFDRKRHLLQWNIEISARMVDDIVLSDLQGDYSYLRNLSFELSLIQHFDNKIQGPGFPSLLSKIENYCNEFSKVLKSLRNIDREKNGDSMTTPLKSEKSLSADLLSPMLSLFTWGDQPEEIIETESGPPPPHGVPFESSHECAKSIETDQRKEESLILILCSELRRQFIRFRDASGGGGGDGVEGERSGLGTEKHTADWIKKCCSSLSSLCYYGDSSSSLQGDTLSAVLTPHWVAAIGTDKENTLFRTMMITIRVIALLSVKNILNTDSTYGKVNENGKSKEEASSKPSNKTSPYLDYSFLDPFAFTATPQSDSHSHRIAQKRAVYLDDLKCMLRWSLPAT